MMIKGISCRGQEGGIRRPVLSIDNRNDRASGQEPAFKHLPLIIIHFKPSVTVKAFAASQNGTSSPVPVMPGGESGNGGSW
jgi:hypothetical protein